MTNENTNKLYDSETTNRCNADELGITAEEYVAERTPAPDPTPSWSMLHPETRAHGAWDRVSRG